MKILHIDYEQLISLENIFQAWKQFKSGKAGRKEVMEFEHNLEDNLFELHKDLTALAYCHGIYEKFIITDPKTRVIHKAKIRDRVVHTLVAKELERIYTPIFVSQSHACIKSRGIHKALNDLASYSRQASRNYTRNFWYLKLDIRKFFDNIDHEVLIKIVLRKVGDKRFSWLIKRIIRSYNSGQAGKGLPLGNFTSQWLANIYLNELDYFIKHDLKVKYYSRYADDFLCLAEKKEDLEDKLGSIKEYLGKNLKLEIHDDKIVLKKFNSGIDFVGYKVLPHYVLIRKRIKKNMLKKLANDRQNLRLGKIGCFQYYQKLNSYLGWLKHANEFNLANQIIYKKV